MLTEANLRDIFDYFKTHFVPTHTSEFYVPGCQTLTLPIRN